MKYTPLWFPEKKIEEDPIPLVITPEKYIDDRGFFLETYKKSEFVKNGIKEDFVQDNHSKSRKNVFRGIHYQRQPKPQGKLVRCTKGQIVDFVVDLRPNSPTFKQYKDVILDTVNCRILYIPAGFGHAFLSLWDDTEIQYKCTNEYDSTLDGGINWNDPEINIYLGFYTDSPILSEKDKNLPFLKDAVL